MRKKDVLSVVFIRLIIEDKSCRAWK